MKTMYSVISCLGEKFCSMLSTVGGYCVAVCVAILDFLAGYRIAIGVVFLAVLLDMVWGIAAAKVQGKYTRSELMRDTVTKIGGYGTALVMTMVLENLIMGSHSTLLHDGTTQRWAVDVIAFIIGCVELWSMSGNILIVRPQSVFFRIIRMSLVGEIANKLGISEEEVKRVFQHNGSFKKVKKPAERSK